MKKQLYKLFAITFVFTIIGVFSVSSFAQSNMIVVEIPFNFHVGNEKLSAGKYEIKRIRENAYLLSNLDGIAKSLAQAPLTIDGPKGIEGEKLVFNRYGDKYFMRQIFGVRSNLGRALFESTTEKNFRLGLDKETEAVNSKLERVEVAINR